MALKAMQEGRNILDPEAAILEANGVNTHAIRSNSDNDLVRNTINWMGTGIRIPSRLLATGDEFFKQLNYRADLYAKLNVEAFDLIQSGKITKEQAGKWVADRMETGFNKDGSARHLESLNVARETTFTNELRQGSFSRNLQNMSNRHPWLYDKLRHGDTLVVRWVDRLGRNYQDVTDTIRHFMRQGVVVRTVINNLTFDGATTDPMQEAVRDALIAFMAATAQAQAEATKEAQKAGIEAAQRDKTKYRGKKPSYDRETLTDVVNMLSKGAGTSEIAKATALTRQTILRIKSDPAAAQAALARWGL